MNEQTHPLLTLLAVFLLVAVIGAAPAAALENLGIVVGLDRANLEGDEPSGFKYQTKTGYLAGAVVEFSLGRDLLLSLQPGYRHTETGISYKDRQAGVVRDSVRLKADWLVLPVVVRVGGRGAFYATGGLDFAIGINGGLEGGEEGIAIGDLVQDVDMAALVGVGFEVPSGRFRSTRRAVQIPKPIRCRAGSGSAVGNSRPACSCPWEARDATRRHRFGVHRPVAGGAHAGRGDVPGRHDDRDTRWHPGIAGPPLRPVSLGAVPVHPHVHA